MTHLAISVTAAVPSSNLPEVGCAAIATAIICVRGGQHTHLPDQVASGR